jgi:hypothetical protein
MSDRPMAPVDDGSTSSTPSTTPAEPPPTSRSALRRAETLERQQVRRARKTRHGQAQRRKNSKSVQFRRMARRAGRPAAKFMDIAGGFLSKRDVQRLLTYAPTDGDAHLTFRQTEAAERASLPPRRITDAAMRFACDRAEALLRKLLREIVTDAVYNARMTIAPHAIYSILRRASNSARFTLGHPPAGISEHAKRTGNLSRVCERAAKRQRQDGRAMRGDGAPGSSESVPPTEVDPVHTAQ